MTNKQSKTIGKRGPEPKLKDYPRKIGIKIKLKLKNWGVISNRQHRSFTDFSGYLANSIISPMVYAPFREQDKRCFATMENLTKHLTNLSSQTEDKELVSVIMPVYNRIETVKNAINSVLDQSYKNLELIVVDDCSDDGTKEVLESIKDPRIVFIYNDSCKGVSNARNHGLKVAKGKYVAYLDSDNLWDSRYLAAMVGAFINLPDAEVIYGGQLLFKGKNVNPYAVRFGSFNRSLLTNRNYIDLNALCHTRDLYKRIGGFDESLVRLVDYDLIMRMSESAQIYSVPVLLSYYYYDNAKNTITNIPGYVEYLELVREKRRQRTEINYENINVEDLKLNKTHPKVSVIIPSYEALEDIKECIDSLLDVNCHEIIVVDNSSSQPVIDYLESLVPEKIKLIKNDINYGFTYAVNQGIEIANPDNDVVIMNNDAIVTPFAIKNLQNAAYKLPNCGITLPQQVLPGNTKTITAHVPYAYPEYECDVNLSAVHENIINVPVFHSGKFLELSFAPFFCVYIKRDTLNSSVGLDAEFGRHYRSDRIFCNYIRHMMNLKIYYVEDAVVYHKLQKSTDVLRSKSKKSSNFDIMFYKNQWDERLASKFGYKKPLWDY
jgi:O-antigen biosynthesis protein